ncbi:MAG: hypothetical protein JXR76_11645 [Deltaproteobacteria bacterium]|nr:hypothetical protein [Deltaproteobacteria bacterium]
MKKQLETNVLANNGNSSDLSAQIRFKEALLECVLSLQGKFKNRSDLGWLLSIAAGSAGTLMAVLNGKKAQNFNQIIRELEQHIMLLKVEEKFMKSRFES